MIYCFDLDGTLCRTPKGDYRKAQPISARIREVNRLFTDGHTIKIWTARGAETGMNWGPLTHEQLGRWGVRHHELLLDKPYADVYVDDRARRDTDFFKGR